MISAHGGGNLLPPQIALVEFTLFLKILFAVLLLLLATKKQKWLNT